MPADRTVFMLDGEPGIRRAVAPVIRSMRLRLERFESAEDFLEAYQGQPGCLLARIELPGISGLQLQDRLSGTDIILPIILMTEQPDVTTAIRAFKSGAVDFLSIPIHELTLRESVQTAIEDDGRRRRQEAFRRRIKARREQLSVEEQEIMELLLNGNQNGQIAEIMDVSPRTVVTRRATILKKMGVATLIELSRLMAVVDGRLQEEMIAAMIEEKLTASGV